jgi:hypothetical protein
MTPMKKLTLNIDELNVHSFETTDTPREDRCTVRGHMDDDNGGDGGGDGGGDYSDVCSAVYSCADWATCNAACNVEQQRRIILY